MMLRQAVACLSLLAIVAGPATAQPGAQTSTPTPIPAPASAAAQLHAPFSTRVVAYQIDAKLDAAKHSISASEVLTYHNLTGQPQQEFPFHLYLNAFQPQSTFITEERMYDPSREWKQESYGSIQITSLEVAGAGDLTNQIQFIQPDDHNTGDHTGALVKLPKPIAPGADVQFKIRFEDQLPRVVARTGFLRDFQMVGQWFPKVGVWWHGAWNCHQFHANTEFFADFGTFDVNLTLPQNEIVGAGGDLVSSKDNSDGTKTLAYHSEDVHDFSWTASPSFIDVEDSWTGSAGEVKIHLLMSPGNMPSAPRYIKVLKGTLQKFDEWYGPYPYDRITVVDPPHGGLSAGGMEYPTLITADTNWFMPKGALLPELVTEHEFGHQYWYGMVATNEFEEAWLDEGINSYTEAKVMDALYGTSTSMFNTPYGTLGEPEGQRAMYLGAIDTDPMTRFAWQFRSGGAYADVTYGKTATVLLTLEKFIGEDTMRQAIHTYFMRYRFTHPTGTDFMKTVEEVSGKDLGWYFDQAIKGTQVLDYEVQSVRSDPVQWWESGPMGKAKSGDTYRNRVVIQRRGDFIAPVDVLVKFDDGETSTEHWDGRDRWIRYTYDKTAKVVSAEIDPTHQILLDRNTFNNSRTVDGDGHATAKLRNIWTFACEWLAQALAWLT